MFLEREFITHSPDGFDIVRSTFYRLDLLTQRSYVNVDGAAITDIGVTPDLVKQRFTGEDALWRRGEHYQQVNSLAGQCTPRPFHSNRPPGKLHGSLLKWRT